MRASQSAAIARLAVEHARRVDPRPTWLLGTVVSASGSEAVVALDSDRAHPVPMFDGIGVSGGDRVWVEDPRKGNARVVASF